MRYFPQLTYNVASCAVCIYSVLLLVTDGETSFQKIIMLAEYPLNWHSLHTCETCGFFLNKHDSKMGIFVTLVLRVMLKIMQPS
jgi:hypothetical protein